MQEHSNQTSSSMIVRSGSIGIAVLLCWTLSFGQRSLTLSPLFTDHMVVQRGKKIPVWGTAASGTIVRVSLGGSYGSTLSDRAGRWKVDLDPLVAGGPYELRVRAGDSLDVHDVMVGEVWLYVGAGEIGELATRDGMSLASGSRNALVRYLNIDRTASSAFRDDPIAGGWREDEGASRRTIPVVASAFAQALQERLEVPVGVMICNSRGTLAESWVAEEALIPVSRVRAHSRELFSPGSITTPGVFFYGTIAPLTRVPLRGVLWDQAGTRIGWPEEYAGVLSALIGDWRIRWGSESLAFFLVEFSRRAGVASEPENLPYLREAQESALRLPHTGIAGTADLGGGTADESNNEIEIGHRLALLARHRVYGEDCEDSGPTFRSIMVPGGSVVIRFDHDASGLMSTLGTAVAGFSVAGRDRVFFPAEARVLSGSVVLFSPDVPHPVAVRYGWDPASPSTLYNREFIPAVPFRTDRWEDARTGEPRNGAGGLQEKKKPARNSRSKPKNLVKEENRPKNE